MLRIRRQRYWSCHTHSGYSATDGMGSVRSIVERSKEIGYRGLALTDHGNIAGSIELYQECRKVGIKPFPGVEAYLVEDRNDKKAKRFHFCVIAFTTQGYRNLVRLTTLSHENFYHKPILDLNDLADLAEKGYTEGLAMTTGCHFGYVTQTLLQEGPQEAKRVINAFSKWFDVYVELQKHNIDQNEEDWVVDALVKIADELDLPLVLGQDSHYTHKHQQETHDAMKEMLSWSEEPGDSVFPGDGYHLVDDQWMIDKYGQELFDRAMEGHERLLDRHDMYIEEMEEYKYRIPSISNNPAWSLRNLCEDSLFLNTPRYRERLEAELEVINAGGMADYFLLVHEVCAWMIEHGIEFQTRGSAAGSLVAYLLRITNVDPIKWGTSFDRFMGKPSEVYKVVLEEPKRKRDGGWVVEDLAHLTTLLEVNKIEYPEWVEQELALLTANPESVETIIRLSYLDQVYVNESNSAIAYAVGIATRPDGPPKSTTVLDRKSPPDIDLDVDNQRRDEVLEFLSERYSISPIGNWSEMGFASDATGEQTHDDKGSVVVKYRSAKRKRLKAQGVPNSEINEQLKWENLTREERRLIQSVSDIRPFSGVGKHACGLILCNSTDELESMVPRMWIASSKSMVSQYNMGQVEAIGLVKLDLLGSKTVTVMSRVAKELGYAGIEDLKQSDTFTFNDKEVYRAMSRGDTEGVFQLEGYASMLGVKKLKPKNIREVIAAMALFRPASESAGATEEYLKRRTGELETPKRHELIDKAIGDTNGVVLYQDQIISILRNYGMKASDLTTFLKAVKASNKNQVKAGKVIDAYMPVVEKMLRDQGVGDEDWEWLKHTFIAATGYGFNLAHATVYGITAYITQWMQVHYADVFFANLITVHLDDPKKVEKYEAAARKRRVRILRADVIESHSTDYRVVKRGVIRRPLQSVKGVGRVAAQCIEEAQADTVEDFLAKVNASKVTGVKDYVYGETPKEDLKGVLKALYNAGAIELP